MTSEQRSNESVQLAELSATLKHMESLLQTLSEKQQANQVMQAELRATLAELRAKTEQNDEALNGSPGSNGLLTRLALLEKATDDTAPGSKGQLYAAIGSAIAAVAAAAVASLSK